MTEGLDGLRERLEEYRGLGARFAKWRAVITIGDGIPTAYCIQVNAHALARYAALCQEQGLVPIVEPEVLMDADNDIETCYRATKRTLHKIFDELYHQRVDLRGDPAEAEHGHLRQGLARPRRARRRWPSGRSGASARPCPAAVPGIVFLSGGQSDEQASENLNAINSLGEQPWVLSFSYGRALQAPALKAWGGNSGERRGRAVVPRAARPLQQRRGRGPLLGGDGGARALELSRTPKTAERTHDASPVGAFDEDVPRSRARPASDHRH